MKRFVLIFLAFASCAGLFACAAAGPGGAFRAQRRNDAEYIAVKACVPHAETIYYSLTGVDFYDRMLSAVGDFQ